MQQSLHFNRNVKVLVLGHKKGDGRWKALKPRKSPTKQESDALFTEEYFTLQVLCLIQYLSKWVFFHESLYLGFSMCMEMSSPQLLT